MNSPDLHLAGSMTEDFHHIVMTTPENVFLDALRDLITEELVEIEYPGYNVDDDVLRDLICNTLDSKCRVKVVISITEG